MMQIQQGMQRLTNAAPGLLPGMGINTGAANVRPPAPNTQNSAYNMQNLMSQVGNRVGESELNLLQVGDRVRRLG